MSTKSFQTDFRFNSRAANAFANALNKSKRVDIQISKPIKRYTAEDSEKIHKRFDSIFRTTEK